MKAHNGMKGQDIVILLKISAKRDIPWQMKDLALGLDISASEISESLNRSMIAGLLSEDKKRPMKSALLEFLVYGLKYVFPQRPGPIVRGIATAHSAFPLNQFINSNDIFVWPYPEGNERGQGIEPLYPTVPQACLRDKFLYELLALTEALRVGKSREIPLATIELKNRL